ncbi:MAG: hypothetical protein KF909_07820 [Rhodocyclaceae bacterium]|nr:hypothetical protein [Rhodocyclaceae bacterium]MCP5239939.1 hypothetical protein [Zoogloeaceae bacterium]MCB1910765.1 hypothetical protein [Rhodocyclaceae bacterium]MCP5253832.1 hypothetical protein [Zoogloeaceae bacterium]MCP5293778.1 hypothetical protein [Zoogloeaceae bacterium]
MNHAHHRHPEPRPRADTSLHRTPLTLLSRPLPLRLAIVGAMAGVMWLAILWALA